MQLREAGEAAQGLAWADIHEDDACGLCYTSGTTGRPKVGAVACVLSVQQVHAWLLLC